MFDTNRPLPLLQTLEVEYSPTWQYWSTCSVSQLIVYDLQLLVQCCPGLRDLQIAVEGEADLFPLTQLQQLTALTVCLKLDENTAQGLAVLTGLKKLGLHTVCLPAAALAWLTKLQNLDSLGIFAETPQGPGNRYSPTEPIFYKISEELLKHPEVNHQFGLHLKTRLVSCGVQCVHPSAMM
jgi:hypothetical protein